MAEIHMSDNTVYNENYVMNKERRSGGLKFLPMFPNLLGFGSAVSHYLSQDQLLQAQRNQDLIEEEEYYESVSLDSWCYLCS